MKRLLLIIWPLSVLLLSACEQGPRDLHYGQEECAHCMMRVSDPSFATQLVTQHGRHYAFDSVECLAGHLEAGDIPEDDVHSLWVANFADPEGDWLKAEDAVYLQSEDLMSPMGLALSAYPDEAAAASYREDYGGELLGWAEVRTVVRDAWGEEGRGHSMSRH